MRRTKEVKKVKRTKNINSKNSKRLNIVKTPRFLVIALVLIVILVGLIYFVFLKYSPIMNFKYEGYAISGKEITENLLGASEDTKDGSTTSKNIELTKIEEQGTIFKKLNDYFVGSKEKTEINLDYPIYINNNSAIYNLAEGSMLISKDFEQIASYPNLSISEGKIYDGSTLERADEKEYIFVKTSANIFINLYEIKIVTTANEYTIPVNSILAFTENELRYYIVKNNVLVFNQINDVDNNSEVQMVENNYTYKELLTKLKILQPENQSLENNEEENIIKEDSTTSTQDKQEDKEEQPEEPVKEENKNGYIKPEVKVEDFTAEVYTASSTLTIKDPKERIVEAPTFEIYKDGKIYLRRMFKASGGIQLTGLVPETEFKVVGKFIYLNENDQKVENTFYEGSFRTKGYEELGSIDLSKENGEIYSNKIQLTKVKITSDLNAEVIKGINQIELETGEIRTVLKNNQVNRLLKGEEITVESSEGLKSDSTIKYTLRFYDKNGIELKVNNNEGETRTSKQAPTARVSIKEQDIVSVELKLNLTNKDKVKLENYKYIVTRPNGEKVKEEKLAENEKEIKLEDLDQNQYYKIGIYADYDLSDNRGKQENIEIGNLVFATQPISTLGSLELVVENKELTSTTSKISYKIDEDRTDKRLIQILNKLTINIVEQGKNSSNESTTNNKETKEGTVVYTDTLIGEEIEKLQQNETKEIKYENLKSNTKYTIEITGNIQLGNTQEEIPITYNYKEFITLKIPAKVEIKNQFVTGNLIDFDVRIEDVDNAVLNKIVRIELRDSQNTLLDLQELTTNEEYIRKTYEKLEENKKYKLSFYADQYNEGNTDSTYKINYLIKEIEILTEPGISGSIGLTELTRKATGKNLVDMSSENKWYVYPNFSTGNHYGKEYNAETKILTLGGNNEGRRVVYDLREYAGQEVTMSFKAKAVSGSQTAYIQNCKTDTNRTKIEGLTEEWKDFQCTLKVDSTGYLGFYINGGNGIEVQELQIELGNKKTMYEEFKYVLQSKYSINLEDKRDEITTNDYYIKVYEDGKLTRTDRYEEIPAENIITNAIKTTEAEPNKRYKLELTIKIKDREYVLSELEYNTQDTEEIKGIYNKEDFLEIQPRGNYIVLGDIDLRGGTGAQYQFGTNIPFEGKVNFNGKSLKKDFINTNNTIFYEIGNDAKLENLVLDISFNNIVEKDIMRGLFYQNYGQIENIIININECTKVGNTFLEILGVENYGTINNFIINFKTKVYFSLDTSTINSNFGNVTNGYIYGENLQGIMQRPSGNDRNGSPLIMANYNNGKVSNIYSLVAVDVNTKERESVANIVVNNTNSANVSNVYSTSIGEGYNLNFGPNVYSVGSTNIQNNYYFADEVFKNSYHTKTTKLALWDENFQNQLINGDGAFNVTELVEKGYYPHLNLPACMPQQEYIALPEVADKDLADILSIDVLEQGANKVKVKFIINNPTAEQITEIKIENINVKILSQEYKDGTSEVIAELYDPIMYISKYNVQSITTKGAFNTPYTRNFENGERTISVDLYREINSIDDWKNISKSLTENYMLMTDLDFSNEGNSIRITQEYTGKLNGNNHTIKNINLTSDYLFTTFNGTLKNLVIQNFRQEKESKAGVYALINNTKNALIDNVHVKDVTLKVNSNVTCSVGVLIGNANSGTIVQNCSARDVTIEKITEEVAPLYRIGGLIGNFAGVSVDNSFVKNLNIISTNNIEQYMGGLVGNISIGKIQNCYVTGGSLSSDKKGLGGLVGYSNSANSVEVYNCFTNIELKSRDDNIGGILGYDLGNDLNNISNNISFGNIYTDKSSANISRAVGNSLEEKNNYAYNEQKINGYIVNEDLGAKLLNYNELCLEATYTRVVGLGDSYDYSKVSQGILPKLYDTTGKNILPYQDDMPIKSAIDLEIANITYEKTSADTVDVLIEISNPSELLITGIEVADMDVKLIRNTTRDGITYMELTGSPTRYYDSYRISKIKYKDGNNEAEKDISAKIDVRFYKDLYSYSDWQAIEKGTYQNYRLANDIDFSGRTDVNNALTMARFESNGYSLKNINITTNENYGSLIKEITSVIDGVNFENITINSTATSYIGIIANSTAGITNVNFKGITINASKAQYVGCIAYSTVDIKNINLTNITVNGNSCVGGLVGKIETALISDIGGENLNIVGTGNYVGGIVGYLNQSIILDNKNLEVRDSNITGKDYTGGVIGNTNSKLTNINLKTSIVKGNMYVGGLVGRKNHKKDTHMDKGIVSNSEIYGTNAYIGGAVGYNYYATSNISVKSTKIIGSSTNSNYVGGLFGHIPDFSVSYCVVEDCEVSSLGSEVGGLIGEIGSSGDTIWNNYVKTTKLEGYSNVGGITGEATEITNIYNILINAKITATNSNAGGVIGYMKNKDMTSAIRIIRFYNINVADSEISAPINAGGLVGNIEKELYTDGVNNYYYNNYVHAKIHSENSEKVSIGIGGYKLDNTKLVNTYAYKYSMINDKYVIDDTDELNTFKYLSSADLKLESTYRNKLGWGGNFNYTSLKNNKYPFISNIANQTGVNLPDDSVYETNTNTGARSLDKPENQFEYSGTKIQTYSNYSVISSSDNKQLSRDTKLYVKDNKLYAVPIVLGTTADGEDITPVADNLILDSYNGKEYETVLGSDGRLYDIKDKIEYPKDFVNKDIESIGNNLASDSHEIEVTYKNGDKVKFNYQTGEVIYSSSAKNSTGEETDKIGIIDYIKEKLAGIGDLTSDETMSVEQANNYEASKELQAKLEETSIEEAIEKQNSGNSEQGDNSKNNFANTEDIATTETNTNDITTTEVDTSQGIEGVASTENNATNNSLKEKKYITIYNEATGEYEIYDEEELLDTSKEEVVSENEKIEANNLDEYYASESETKNTKLGIVWIVLSIIGVGIVLFALKKNLRKGK